MVCRCFIRDHSKILQASFQVYLLQPYSTNVTKRLVRAPKLYYRDKDSREIDLLIEQDQTLYPIEIKKTASPKKDAVQTFSTLARFRPNVGPGAVICMADRMVPIG